MSDDKVNGWYFSNELFEDIKAEPSTRFMTMISRMESILSVLLLASIGLNCNSTPLCVGMCKRDRYVFSWRGETGAVVAGEEPEEEEEEVEEEEEEEKEATRRTFGMAFGTISRNN